MLKIILKSKKCSIMYFFNNWIVKHYVNVIKKKFKYPEYFLKNIDYKLLSKEIYILFPLLFIGVKYINGRSLAIILLFFTKVCTYNACRLPTMLPSFSIPSSCLPREFR